MLTVQATVVGPNVPEPAVMLQVWDPGHIEGPPWGRRYLYAMRDGGRWAFSDHGSRYDFEDVAEYDARRVRDRFTVEMLRRYLRELGVPVVRANDVRRAVYVERVPPAQPATG